MCCTERLVVSQSEKRICGMLGFNALNARVMEGKGQLRSMLT